MPPRWAAACAATQCQRCGQPGHHLGLASATPSPWGPT
jgi:hypothetical protein